MANYHLSLTTGSREDGNSAVAHAGYVARIGMYANRTDLGHIESANMPSWTSPLDAVGMDYWQAADDYERADGRLYLELEFSLPVELSPEVQIALARQYAELVSTVQEGHLPITWSLHDKGDGNPHIHLMLSERAHDGHDRTPALWFSRKATGKSRGIADGGAPKARSVKQKAWLNNARETWAQLANRALASMGSKERISHLSLVAQGIDRDAQVHLGPAIWSHLQDGREDELGTNAQQKIEHNRSAILQKDIAAAERELADALGETFDEQVQEVEELKKQAGKKPSVVQVPKVTNPEQIHEYKPTYKPSYPAAIAAGPRRTLSGAPTIYGLRTLPGSIVVHDDRLERDKAKRVLQGDALADVVARPRASAEGLRRAADSGVQNRRRLEELTPLPALFDPREATPEQRLAGKRLRERVRIDDFMARAPNNPAAVGDTTVKSSALKDLHANAVRFEPWRGKYGVLYIRRPDDVFTLIDTGTRIKVAKVDGDAAAACVTLAAEKWGTFELQGDAVFKKLAVAEAVKLGLAHTISNPELQALIASSLLAAGRAAAPEKVSLPARGRRPR